MEAIEWTPGEHPPPELRALEPADIFWEGWSTRLSASGISGLSLLLLADGDIAVRAQTAAGIVSPGVYGNLDEAFRHLTRREPPDPAEFDRSDPPLPRPSRVDRLPPPDTKPSGG